jgi:hypothetical protein
MGTTIHPEATYLLFPFNIPDAQARFDIGGVPVRPHLDQIPGSCRDYFTVQGWVDFNNGSTALRSPRPKTRWCSLVISTSRTINRTSRWSARCSWAG